MALQAHLRGQAYISVRGGSTVGARERLPTRRLLAKKTETPGRSEVGFISPRMHQNSPFELKNRKKFLRRGHSPFPRPIPGGEGTPSAHTLPPSPPSTPRSTRLRRSTRLAPSALDLGPYGSSIRLLATPSGSAPAYHGLIPECHRIRRSCPLW